LREAVRGHGHVVLAVAFEDALESPQGFDTVAKPAFGGGECETDAGNAEVAQVLSGLVVVGGCSQANERSEDFARLEAGTKRNFAGWHELTHVQIGDAIGDQFAHQRIRTHDHRFVRFALTVRQPSRGDQVLRPVAVLPLER
jgi:hypothetical protein